MNEVAYIEVAYIKPALTLSQNYGSGPVKSLKIESMYC